MGKKILAKTPGTVKRAKLERKIFKGLDPRQEGPKYE